MKDSRTIMEPSGPQAKKQDKYYFYYCPIFDFWAFGKTKEEAWRMLKEDLFLLLSRCSRYESHTQAIRKPVFAAIAEIRI